MIIESLGRAMEDQHAMKLWERQHGAMYTASHMHKEARLAPSKGGGEEGMICVFAFKTSQNLGA